MRLCSMFVNLILFGRQTYQFQFCMSWCSVQVSIDSSLVGDSEIYWTRNGHATQLERTQIKPSPNPTLASTYLITHTIPMVQDGDIGAYACHVITSFDSVHSQYGSLTVRSGTRIVSQPQSRQAINGQDVDFM